MIDLEHEIKVIVERTVLQRVNLLMIRPITEEIAMQVEEIEGFEDLDIVDGDWVGFEEIDLEGELMGGEEHGWIESILIYALTDWSLKNNAGRFYTGDTNFVLEGEPGEVRLKRRPDVAFVAQSRLQKTKGYFYGSPDLAIEIKSPSQRRAKMLTKVNEYLTHGVRQVWLVLPDERQVEVHTPDGAVQVYGIGQMLPGGELLPGFELDLAKIFEV